MQNWKAIFTDLVVRHLVPEFCDHPTRGFSASKFQASSLILSEFDARNFVKAWEAALITHAGRGQYRAPQSKAMEQFFWSGAKRTPDGALLPPEQRTFTFWVEPAITVATLARLHFEFDWPKHLLGTQSLGYAFDAMAFLTQEAESEHIACEIKKSEREIDELIRWMLDCSTSDMDVSAGMVSKQKNAYAKVKALRERRPQIFWAVGPGGVGHVYDVLYGNDGAPSFVEVDERRLIYPGNGPEISAPESNRTNAPGRGRSRFIWERET